MSRVLEIAPERLDRWLAGFGERHGGVEVTSGAMGPRAVGGDGSVAECEVFEHDPVGLVLVRRGGYAVGIARSGRLLAHKTGTRYVQARTSAGGWSQQRFARRRGNQADELVRAVVGHAERVVLRGPATPRGLVLGGDRALARSVMADPRLATLTGLPTRELPDLTDPKLAVLETAVRRGRAVRVTLTESGADGTT